MRRSASMGGCHLALVLVSNKLTAPVGLGYLGVDVAIDCEAGPLVLELNARPGLSIRNADHCGIARRL